MPWRCVSGVGGGTKHMNIEQKEIYLVCRRDVSGCTENVWAFTEKIRAEQYVIEMNIGASKHLSYYIQEVFLDI